MKYIKKLDRCFYSVELDNKYFITDMNGINKRITEKQYHNLLFENFTPE
jgi:hypothetical protein